MSHYPRITSAKAPRPGDILLFGRPRGLNFFITILTRSPFFHAGIYAGNEQIVEMKVRGVKQNNLRKRFFPRRFAVLPAPGDSGLAALDWAQRQIGVKYDYRDVAIILLNRLHPAFNFKNTPNRFTCGEFVAVAFDQAGVRLLPDIELSATAPGDLARLLPKNAPVMAIEEYERLPESC